MVAISLSGSGEGPRSSRPGATRQRVPAHQFQTAPPVTVDIAPHLRSAHLREKYRKFTKMAPRPLLLSGHGGKPQPHRRPQWRSHTLYTHTYAYIYLGDHMQTASPPPLAACFGTPQASARSSGATPCRAVRLRLLHHARSACPDLRWISRARTRDDRLGEKSAVREDLRRGRLLRDRRDDVLMMLPLSSHNLG